MASNSDLLEHYKLDANQLDGSVIHYSFVSDRARGLRKARVQERWDNIEMVGQGSFGDVWLQRREGSTTQRAVKVLRKMSLQFQSIEYKRELEALAKFDKSQIRQQEVIVQFFGWWEVEHSVYLAMEYFELGDLSRYMTEGCISEQDAKDIALDLLQALVIMHSEGFTHRDLKPQNIFVAQVSPRYWVKLGDFGIAKRVTNQSTALRTEIGTPYFSAPETEPDDYQENFEYTNAVDVWSLGCVVYNCLAQRPPFQNRRAKALPFPMQPLKGKVHVDSFAFLECLLKVDPMTRCTAQEALDHPWLQNVSDSSIAADKGSGASTNDSSYSIPTLNGYDSITSQAALLDIQCSTSSRALKPLETPHVVTVSDLTAAATTNASESKARTEIHAPRSVGLTATECELLGVGSALTTPFWTVPKDSGERTVLSKDSPVKDQLSKLATNEMNGQKSEVFEDMELINCFRGPAPSLRLSYQVSSGDMNTARRLIRRGTNLKIKDTDGRTALHWAVMKCFRARDGCNSEDIVRELLERGAEVVARDNLCNTPLLSIIPEYFALEGIRLAVICLLLGYNADVNAKNWLGTTCLHRVASWSTTRAYEVCRVIDVLLKHGADVNAKEYNGATALHYVQHSEVAERLLLAGIDVDAVNSSGVTALQHATWLNLQGVAKAILSFKERPRKV